MHWLFECQVDRTPHALAVDDGSAVLDYAELNGRANKIAHHLQSHGIGTGDHVGVLMHRSCELVAAVLGILKSGAAYVPLEPAWPAERIRWAAAELRMAALLIDPLEARIIRALSSHLPDQMKIVCVRQKQIGLLQPHQSGHDVGWSGDLPCENPRRTSGPDDRAYVIFTSGSTGQPKAVAVRHRAVINLIDWVNKTFGVDSSDRILFTTSIAFDLSVYDIFGLLAAGGSIRVATTDELRDPELLGYVLEREKITFWDSAPAAMERLLPFLQSGEPSNDLRLVFLSGDWIPVSLPAKLKRIYSSVRLIALGGATEATVWSNFYEVGDVDPRWKSIPYGRPIQNVRYYILDASMKPCAVGAAGDLYIAGACLAEGYANDAQLTASRFTPNPLVNGDRLYRTGDRARYFPDGNIEFLGRADRQVKIRGFRVEPAEIEFALQQNPLVQRALVLADGEDCGNKRLTAYIVPKCSTNESIVQELRNVLRLRLPEYMVPAAFHLLRDLPLTISGKPDVVALRAMTPEPEVSCGAAHSPRTETEQKLATIWCSILRRKWIAIDDNFFDVGGDSLQAVQMIAAAAGMGLNLRLNDLLEYPTIRTLATRCRAVGKSPSAPEAADEVPLTPTQHWLFHRSLRQPERYNMVFAFEADASLTPMTLRRALAHLRLHHAALRLRFRFIAGVWHQSLHAAEIERPVVEWNLSSLEANEQNQQIECRVAALRRQMDLDRGPLFCAILVNRGSGRPQTLLLLFHHLVIDAASVCIIAEDLNTAIEQIERGDAICLPTADSFVAFAHCLRQFADSRARIEDADYWLSLPWRKVRPLPRDVEGTANLYGSSRTLRARLSRQETRALKHELPRRHGASVGEILLAACLQTLGDWSHCENVLVDLTHHGRQELFDDLSLSRTVGLLTSNVPILITLPTGAPMAEAVATVHGHLGRMPRCGLSLGVLRYMTSQNECIAPLNRLPEAELKFNYLGSMMMMEPSGLDRLRPVPVTFAGVLDPLEPRAYLHNLELALVGDRLHVEWKYNAEAHREQTIQRLISDFIDCLRELIHLGKAKARLGAVAAGSGGPR